MSERQARKQAYNFTFIFVGRLTASGSGGCKAADKNSPMVPICKLFICKHNELRGVLRSSGS